MWIGIKIITNNNDNSNPLVWFGPSSQKNYGHTSSKDNHGTYTKKYTAIINEIASSICIELYS